MPLPLNLEVLIYANEKVPAVSLFAHSESRATTLGQFR